MAICLGSMVLAGAGCRLPVSHDQRSAGAVSSAVLGTRFARVTTSRLETGDPVLDELDDFITAVGFDFNLPASEAVDMQLYFGNREAAGESVDAFVGPYEMIFDGWYVGVGATGHSRPDEELDPFMFVGLQYLSVDISYWDSAGAVFVDDEEVGWIAGGGVEWRPTASIAVAPYIKYFDNATFGAGTRVGGRFNFWLDQRWFLEVSGESPISESGHALGLGLGFRY